MASSRIITNDILEHVAQQAKFDVIYSVLMATGGILAAVALLTNSVPILVGSMVVAPALPPLGLIAFALAARQPSLAFRGLWIAVVGLLIATLFAVLTTWIMNVTNVIPPETNLLDKPLLEERVRPGWYSVVAAMAGGIAGAIALAQKKTDTLVGVVAALALVPATGAAGIAMLSDDPMRSLGGLALLGINMGLVVVAGLLTLLVMRPDKQE